MTDFSALAQVYHGENALAESRATVLKTLTVAILGLAYISAWANAIRISSVPGGMLPVVASLMATAVLIYWGLHYGPLVSTTMMVLGLTVTLTILLFLYQRSMFASYFCLIVLAAGSTIGWHYGLGTATLISIIILLLGCLMPTELSPMVMSQALSLMWGTVLLTWLSTRPLRIAVDWAWNSYALAQTKMEEARERQAELARLTKSLSETCERLEQLNWELKEAREAADAARRVKAQFAATVGHELRTPVNLIIGFSQMMASSRRASYYDEPLPASYRDDVEVIYRNACHVSSLVDDILDLSQVDAQRMALHKERIPLIQIVEEAVASVEALFADARLKLSVDVPADLPLIPADPVRIRQVLINLLFNSVRFTHRGGVTITAISSEAEIVVRVCDSGIGISPTELPNLFEDFRQAQDVSRGRGGSGLGLAVCKRFVELHGGSIWAESVPGSGTTISFSLPLHDNIVVVPFRRLPVIVDQSDGLWSRVAVLDPVGDAARLLQRYLDGYHVRRLTSVEEAAQLAANGQVPVLIVTSPGVHQAWHNYQQAHPSLDCVATLFCPLHTREVITTSLGVAAYLVKPVLSHELAQTLRRLPRPLRNLVVIEDDAEMRVLLARMLHSFSRRYRIAEAADGNTGLRIIRQLHPDAVLLDLLLPDMDGQSVLQIMQQDAELSRIPVVVISAKGTEQGDRLAAMVEISRRGGFSVGEAMAYLKADLDAFFRLQRGPDQREADQELAVRR